MFRPGKKIYALLLLTFAYASTVAAILPKLEPRHIAKWTVLNYTWDATHSERFYTQKSLYVPKNNAIAGIEVWKNSLFLTVPRWKDGVPSTLNVVKLPKKGAEVLVNEPLTPYPSWADNELGNCKKFQWVQSIAIDDRSIMWVLDKGRLNGVNCP